MLTTVTPSAPASRATSAIPAMSGSTGDSLATSGSRVRARQSATIRSTHCALAPNSMPPADVLGQDRLSSKPATPGASSSPDTTSAYSSTVKPTTFTSTWARCSRVASQGRWSARTAASPGFARPTELSMPPRNSATLGGRLPARGWRETAFVTSPPRRSRSRTPSSSRPNPAVPAARSTGFWKRRPKTVRERPGSALTARARAGAAERRPGGRRRSSLPAIWAAGAGEPGWSGCRARRLGASPPAPDSRRALRP